MRSWRRPENLKEMRRDAGTGETWDQGLAKKVHSCALAEPPCQPSFNSADMSLLRTFINIQYKAWSSFTKIQFNFCWRNQKQKCVGETSLREHHHCIKVSEMSRAVILYGLFRIRRKVFLLLEAHLDVFQAYIISSWSYLLFILVFDSGKNSELALSWADWRMVVLTTW